MSQTDEITYEKGTIRHSAYFKLKTAVDFLGALLGVLVLSPLLLGIVAAIELEEPGTNPFFSQKRIGRNKTPFQMYKFRTMRTDAPHDMPTHLLTNPEQYITRIGAFLRKSSLDELPQLFNVLQGRLAVVGPRPALWNQYDLIAERERYGVNAIRPGITGWAQIHGRDELEIDEKARLDGYYLRHVSPLLDLKCLWGTVFAVAHADGVTEGGTGSGAAFSSRENKK